MARSHEEELFAKLTERTEDLEALQESYVSLTDRYALRPGHVRCFSFSRLTCACDRPRFRSPFSAVLVVIARAGSYMVLLVEDGGKSISLRSPRTTTEPRDDA